MTMLHTSASWTLATIKRRAVAADLNQFRSPPSQREYPLLPANYCEHPKALPPTRAASAVSEQARKDGWPTAVARLSHRHHPPRTAIDTVRTRKTAQAVPALRAKPAATHERIQFQEQWAFSPSPTCTTGHAPLDTFIALQHHPHHLLRRHSDSSNLPCAAG